MAEHQKSARAFLRRRDWRGALFMEPGLGKTRVALDVARSARALVMAPLNPALHTWPEQHHEWASDIDLKLVRGTPKERARILFDEKPQVAVLNYEMTHWFYDQVRQRRRLPYDVLILDESTAVKSQDSIAFRALKGLEPAFDAVIPMTGTPAENSLHDVWGQLYFVDRGEALGKRIGIFRERYCSPVVRENYVTWKVTRAEELRRACAHLCFVRRSDDCLDMPPLTFRDVRFDLTNAERRFYDHVKSTHVVPVAEPYPLENAGVVLDKLRQVCSGFVYDEEKVPHVIDLVPSKVRVLEECVAESFGSPMLVGFWFQGSKKVMLDALGPRTPCIDRFTHPSKKAELFEAWRRGQLPILLGQIKTVAYGMNMQSPHASVLLFDLPWSHGQHWQFIRRVWRQGQMSGVMVRRLIADRTCEGYVASVLKRKQHDEEELMSTILDEEIL